MTTHNANNERIKRRYFAYLKEAKRHSEPTVDAVAKPLSRFESHTKHRDFKAYPRGDATHIASLAVALWFSKRMRTSEEFGQASTACPDVRYACPAVYFWICSNQN